MAYHGNTKGAPHQAVDVGGQGGRSRIFWEIKSGGWKIIRIVEGVARVCECFGLAIQILGCGGQVSDSKENRSSE